MPFRLKGGRSLGEYVVKCQRVFFPVVPSCGKAEKIFLFWFDNVLSIVVLSTILNQYCI